MYFRRCGKEREKQNIKTRGSYEVEWGEEHIRERGGGERDGGRKQKKVCGLLLSLSLSLSLSFPVLNSQHRVYNPYLAATTHRHTHTHIEEAANVRI